MKDFELISLDCVFFHEQLFVALHMLRLYFYCILYNLPSDLFPLCRESYPSRYTHSDFIGTFSCICSQAGGADARSACLSIVQSIKIDPKLYRLGKTMILLKREVVDGMERMRAQLLGGRARTLQNTIRRFLARQDLSLKRDRRRKYLSTVRLQSSFRRTLTRINYVKMIIALRLQEQKRRDDEERKREALPDAAPPTVADQQAVQISRAAVLQGMASNDNSLEETNDDVEGYLEDEKDEAAKGSQPVYGVNRQSSSRSLTQHEEVPVSPLCIRIQVHAEGITEALLFHVDLLASAIRQAVTIKDHKVRSLPHLVMSTGLDRPSSSPSGTRTARCVPCHIL